jgi:serine/threonine protein phosphatase PrpC
VQRLRAGSTAVVAHIRGGKQLTLAWAGDSRAVLIDRVSARTLTSAHSTDCEAERERIECAGGKLFDVGGELRVAGQINVTRSFGDLYFFVRLIA